MKGYFVSDGYMGLVNGVYRLFADESDYREFMEDLRQPMIVRILSASAAASAAWPSSFM